MQKFNIAGILMEVHSNKLYTNDKLKSFSSDYIVKPDLKIKIKGSGIVNQPKGRILLSERIKWTRGMPLDNQINACICVEGSDEIAINIEVNDEWNKATVKYLENEYDDRFMLEELPCELIFRNRILLHEGIVIHASAIEYEGYGILFTAPSGTGKSTQANLWKVHMGAKTLNDDRPAIRIINNKSYVYGTPWSGSSPDFSNGCAPIAGIFILEQAVQNTVQKLDNKEAVSRLMARTFLPYYDTDLMDMAINNLEKIINNTPVYLLRCRPDREAVELVYQCIK